MIWLVFQFRFVFYFIFWFILQIDEKCRNFMFNSDSDWLMLNKGSPREPNYQNRGNQVIIDCVVNHSSTNFTHFY